MKLSLKYHINVGIGSQVPQSHVQAVRSALPKGFATTELLAKYLVKILWLTHLFANQIKTNNKESKPLKQ